MAGSRRKRALGVHGETSSKKPESAVNAGQPRYPRRPERADRDYVVGLVREHCLTPDVPEKAARAIVSMMCKLGVLTEDERGHIEIPSQLGATLELPERSGKALWQLMRTWVGRGSPYDAIAYLIVGSGSSGSGSTGSSRGYGGAHTVTYSFDLRGWLRELEWDRDKIIAGMGAAVSEEAEVIVGTVIDRLWTEIEPNGRADASGELPQRQRDVLQALIQLKAKDEATRRSAEDVAKCAFGADDAGNAKKPLAELAKRGFVGSVEGRGGGSWIAPAGVAWARRYGLMAQ